MFDEPISTDEAAYGIRHGAAVEAHDNDTESLASGFPQQQAMTLSFNDLPSRAQHLVLNELMAKNSEDAVVIFTTLPGPAEGTGKSEQDCVRYLSDLEVLCANLPPVLLVHSNAVTVTVSL
jgi:potassium/chloride transporter 9